MIGESEKDSKPHWKKDLVRIESSCDSLEKEDEELGLFLLLASSRAHHSSHGGASLPGMPFSAQL
jgi:hypothetical protein